MQVHAQELENEKWGIHYLQASDTLVTQIRKLFKAAVIGTGLEHEIEDPIEWKSGIEEIANRHRPRVLENCNAECRPDQGRPDGDEVADDICCPAAFEEDLEESSHPDLHKVGLSVIVQKYYTTDYLFFQIMMTAAQ